MLKQFFATIGDTIFPPQCPACSDILREQLLDIFCPECRRKIKFIDESICPVCGRPFFASAALSHICGDCLVRKPHFQVARSMAGFETIIMEAIHQFKYGHKLAVGEALGVLMANFSFPFFDCQGYDLMLPVPLHIKKLRERGFNQSLLLARQLANKWTIPVDFSLLKRQKFTLSQTGLNKKEREENIRGAFVVSDKKKVTGKKIILVDDVYTTGATLNECAKTLRKAGAVEVAVLTLARVIPGRAQQN